MGCRVYVVKKHAEYGNFCGFNWQKDDFRQLLDDLGANMCGEEYGDNYECEVYEYKKALKTVARFARYTKNKEAGHKDKFHDRKKLLAALGEVDWTLKDLTKSIKELGGADEVLKTMRGFYVERDRNSDYISFEAW